METWKLVWTKLAPLNDTSIGKVGPRIAGVYRLSFLADDGNYYVFYVGKSEDIASRLKDHISDSEANVGIQGYVKSKKCSFKYAQITQEAVRAATERKVYHVYSPSCNDQEPPGRDDVDINMN